LQSVTMAGKFAFVASSGLPKHAAHGDPRGGDPCRFSRRRAEWRSMAGLPWELYTPLTVRSFTERRSDLAVTALAFGKPRANGDYPTLLRSARAVISMRLALRQRRRELATYQRRRT